MLSALSFYGTRNVPTTLHPDLLGLKTRSMLHAHAAGFQPYQRIYP